MPPAQEVAVGSTGPVRVVDRPATTFSRLPVQEVGDDVLAFREALQLVGWNGGAAVEPGQSVRVDAPPAEVHLRLDARTALTWSGATLVTETASQDPSDLLSGIGRRGSVVQLAAECGVAGYKASALLQQESPTRQDWGSWAASAIGVGQAGAGCGQAVRERTAAPAAAEQRLLATATTDTAWSARTAVALPPAVRQGGLVARLCGAVSRC